MVSPTTQTKRRRLIRGQKAGNKRRRQARREGTPAFPLDPASGINSTAPASSKAS